ncbi:hypothetical protein SteCoe_30597 [Stentor coeruleus]|uniref:Uncharacterized protein n=1 Tax=Stentor coeruleus TaxID=5963 RepID=A0A1R2B380_9CILI|nr:hypothetical protein SteCoe_30597 [Stentor coeruleus]
MNRTNQESIDSPFHPDGMAKPIVNTRVLKQKLCGGVSAESPTYFHLKYIDILDQRSRTQELFKGYKLKEKNDYQLVSHPDQVPQQKKYFNYVDYNMDKNAKVFDYASIRPSDLIDLLADKRPDFKKKSLFYSKYNEKLKKEGFGLSRGIFTVASNNEHKFNKGWSIKNSEQELQKHGFRTSRFNNSSKSTTVQGELIREQTNNMLPVGIRTGKTSMSRYLTNRKNYSDQGIRPLIASKNFRS